MKAARTVPVLMYHHVSPSDGMITTSPTNFESQMAWLAKNGYGSLTTAEFAGHLNGNPVPEKSVLITFDDGYLDNWVYAHPVLSKYGFSAVMFVVSSWIQNGPIRPYAGQGAVPATPSHNDCKKYIADGRADEVIVRWSEIHAMRTAGTFEVHSHTHTHTRWDQQASSVAEKRERIAEEFSLARATLTANLGTVSDHLCWPQGYFDDDYVELAKQAGFRYLYTTDAYGQNIPGANPEHIYRFAVRNRAGATLGRRTSIAASDTWGPLYNKWKSWKRAGRNKA
ncbi:MAG TPA: polysaccharide deacetylase family protein [Eoetvoesiella sp.]